MIWDAFGESVGQKEIKNMEKKLSDPQRPSGCMHLIEEPTISEK
jgi:hypothetical protein